MHIRSHCGLPSLYGLPLLALDQADKRCQFVADIHVVFFCYCCFTSYPSRKPTIYRQIIFLVCNAWCIFRQSHLRESDLIAPRLVRTTVCRVTRVITALHKSRYPWSVTHCISIDLCRCLMHHTRSHVTRYDVVAPYVTHTVLIMPAQPIASLPFTGITYYSGLSVFRKSATWAAMGIESIDIWS